MSDPGKPVTQEFILKLLGWAAFIALAAFVFYQVSKGIDADNAHMDRVSDVNARPLIRP